MSVSRFNLTTSVDVLELEGDFDMSNVADVGRALDDAADARAVIVDLSDVTFLDSTMLHSLQRARRRLRRVELLLVRPQKHVWHVFELTMLDRLFTSFDSFAAAARRAARAPEVHGVRR